MHGRWWAGAVARKRGSQLHRRGRSLALLVDGELGNEGGWRAWAPQREGEYVLACPLVQEADARKFCARACEPALCRVAFRDEARDAEAALAQNLEVLDRSVLAVACGVKEISGRVESRLQVSDQLVALKQ